MVWPSESDDGGPYTFGPGTPLSRQELVIYDLKNKEVLTAAEKISSKAQLGKCALHKGYIAGAHRASLQLRSMTAQDFFCKVREV